MGVRTVADKARGWGSGEKMQVCMHKSEETKVGNGLIEAREKR